MRDAPLHNYLAELAPLTPGEYRDLYLCTFKPTPRTQLDELAAEYHERCEAYDRTVCTGPIIRGEIMPANWCERELINRNAAALRHALFVCAENVGFTRQQITEAFKNARPR
jgi:hypothetical protein